MIKQCKVRSGALTEEIYSAIARHDYVDVHEFSSRAAEVDSLIRVIKRIPSVDPTENDRFLEFLFNVINPNEMEQYLAMYHCGNEKVNRE